MWTTAQMRLRSWCTCPLPWKRQARSLIMLAAVLPLSNRVSQATCKQPGLLDAVLACARQPVVSRQAAWPRLLICRACVRLSADLLCAVHSVLRG